MALGSDSMVNCRDGRPQWPFVRPLDRPPPDDLTRWRRVDRKPWPIVEAAALPQRTTRRTRIKGRLSSVLRPQPGRAGCCSMIQMMSISNATIPI
jgi:hypothetical protein